MYRKRIWSNVWHYVRSCHQYPSDAMINRGGAVQRESKPRSGDFCNTCRSKAKRAKR